MTLIAWLLGCILRDCHLHLDCHGRPERVRFHELRVLAWMVAFCATGWLLGSLLAEMTR